MTTFSVLFLFFYFYSFHFLLLLPFCSLLSWYFFSLAFQFCMTNISDSSSTWISFLWKKIRRRAAAVTLKRYFRRSASVTMNKIHFILFGRKYFPFTIFYFSFFSTFILFYLSVHSYSFTSFSFSFFFLSFSFFRSCCCVVCRQTAMMITMKMELLHDQRFLYFSFPILSFRMDVLKWYWKRSWMRYLRSHEPDSCVR